MPRRFKTILVTARSCAFLVIVFAISVPGIRCRQLVWAPRAIQPLQSIVRPVSIDLADQNGPSRLGTFAASAPVVRSKADSSIELLTSHAPFLAGFEEMPKVFLLVRLKSAVRRTDPPDSFV
jgi:hypothetical protein